MHVLIIGGTGFIGYHSCRELLSRGHQVTLMGLPPAPPAGLFPKGARVRLADLRELSDRQLQRALSPYNAVVFAAGADDRVTPTGPAYEFFYEANVRSTVRVTAAATRAGVEKLVLLGSYFTYFNRKWPDMALAEHHPYIMSRREQMELGAAVAGDDVAFITLELPYIFGAMPGVVPLWDPLVRYVRSGVELFYTRGGSNMIAVEHVAEAIAGACERIERSRVYQVGDRNVSWTALLQGLCAAAGREDDNVHIIAEELVHNVGWIGDFVYRLQGREGGLQPSHFTHMQTANAYFDPSASRRALGYGRGGLEEAWRQTVDACPVSGRQEAASQYIALVRKFLRLPKAR
jgi:nucleoside-diphosphate-sugar epimerase